MQRSLGLNWDLETDSFTFRVSLKETPFTRRGVLSIVSSLYDPLGLIAPVTIQGKLILRNLISGKVDRDGALSENHRALWEHWGASENLLIPRAYSTVSLRAAVRVEIHTFCDASVQAIAAVSYLIMFYKDGTTHLVFVMGKAKIAPKHATTKPRLKLCAAVLAAETSKIVERNIDFKVESVIFYTESKIVLGYLYNETRRFYVYVTNRVQHSTETTSPDQWRYVSTQKNPADLATRCLTADKINDNVWIKRPKHFQDKHFKDGTLEVSEDSYPLLSSCENKEVRPMEPVCTFSTNVHADKEMDLDHTDSNVFRSGENLLEPLCCLNSMSHVGKGPIYPILPRGL